ncbi:ABC transporter permease [uncultured Campylobacter sp.]|uniref:MlaE family ABC transporter permease n=1 Tax=uncultured Campylobacter sp. TaxID=218934 RepID=UPI0026391FE8|nr:ABC transporter permease [uncultured Campylobacter sp.]
MEKASFNVDKNKISLDGVWTYSADKNSIRLLKEEMANLQNEVIFDMSNLKELDYALAIIICRFSLQNNLKIKLINSNKTYDAIFALTKNQSLQNSYKFKKQNIFEEIGVAVYGAFLSFMSFLNFLGELSIKTLYNLLNFRKIRLKTISNICKDGGINSIFIVCLTSFLIGVVLIYIGSEMLADFGATFFIVEIMGMLTFRELSPLIAAIVVAGRSASSFTAEIGVMKITDEIDAMKTMGFDPFVNLVIPRIIAMALIMPFVVFLADMASVLGQLLVSYYYLDIDLFVYFDRVKNLVEIRHFYLGLLKAPFFGLAIALIGCFRGFEVSKNSLSIGRLTTKSVVNAIFWVIMIDCIFAILFMKVGW